MEGSPVNYTMDEVLQFIAENDVKFIRLAFCDMFGRQKNISIMPDELSRAFSTGISFDASAVPGFMNVEESDLFLVPDPATLSILPWRPSTGRVVRFFCDIRHPDGRPFEGDGRHILKRAISRASELGYTCKIGSECEFYLFETDDFGQPTMTPQDQGGYCDIAPLDRAENVRREICLTLEEMGIYPESSHHEQGPGQNEIDFKYGDALLAADHLITFQSVVKAIAAQNGLYASFLPKPFPDKSGSGLHVNLSLFQNGENIFQHGSRLHPKAGHFIAGVLRRVPEMTVFLNPIPNSYRRFGSFEAPRFVTWSYQNRSQLVRIPAATGNFSRMELRSPDPACNPYLCFALILSAGLEGIEEELPLCPPVDRNLYCADSSEFSEEQILPADLGQALARSQDSRFLADVIGADTAARFIEHKKLEWKDYCAAEDPRVFDYQRYFRTL